jgi:hypothetical protein
MLSRVALGCTGGETGRLKSSFTPAEASTLETCRRVEVVFDREWEGRVGLAEKQVPHERKASTSRLVSSATLGFSDRIACADDQQGGRQAKGLLENVRVRVADQGVAEE